jgi:hypothetical protein
MELSRRMADPSPKKCPLCGSKKFTQLLSRCYFQGACDAAQENQNNGAGMYYPQFGKRYLDPHTKTKLNPAAHHRSRADALEYGKRKGWDIEKH